MKPKLQGSREIKRIDKVDCKIKMLIGRALSPRSILVEVINRIIGVFRMTPLERTTPFLDIVKRGTLVNDIGKLEPVLLVEKLGIRLWIAQRDIARLQILKLMKGRGRNQRCKGVSSR